MENFIKTYKELCEKYNDESLEINAKDIFELQDWIIRFENISKKDYLEYFNYNLDNFLENYQEEVEKKDILLHLLETVKNSIFYIMNNMRTKIIREDIMLPASKVKEINSKGIMWLSRKPGDTIRKKLASARNMLSIKRRLSIDTGENRLFVEFLKQIKYYLELRLDNLPKDLTEKLFIELYTIIDTFLKNDELEEVKRWTNLPPNNTLLSDQNYRRIWNAWNDLRDLDLDIEKYSDETEACKRIDTVDNLKKILKARGNNYIFPQLPFNVIIKDYKIEEYKPIIAISPENKLVNLANIKNTKLKEKYNRKEKEILINEKIISTDLFHIKPICVNENDEILNLSNKILFQQFSENNFVSCEKSEAIFFNEDIETFSFSKTLNNKNEEKLRRVMKIVERNIKTNILNTAFPDILDPFQVSTLSKKLRLSYKKVRILPRSIASVYALNDNVIFKNEYKNNENILIFDIVNKKITFTLLRGKEEDNYSNFIWERYWTNKKEIESSFFEKLEEILNVNSSELEELYSLNEIEDLINGFEKFKLVLNDKILEFDSKIVKLIKDNRIDISEIVDEVLKNNQEITKENLHIITLKNSIKIDESYYRTFNYLNPKDLVKGCSSYHRIFNELNKEKNEKVILWRDYLPYLGIKKMYGRFDLIKNQRVQPMYDEKQSIPIEGYITLAKGKDKHKFTLVGEDQNEEIIYEAVVKHKTPLKEDIECKLELSYTYGSDDPYELYFTPVKSKEFARVKVDWEERKEYEYKDLKYPHFPEKEDWDNPEIQKIISNKGNIFSWLTNWCFLNTKNIDFGEDNTVILNGIDGNLCVPYEYYDKRIDKIDGKNIILKTILTETERRVIEENEIVSFFINMKRGKRNKYKLSGISHLWRRDKNGELFIKLNADVIEKESYKILFIYQDKFLVQDDCYVFLDEIEFDIENHKGNYRAVNIKDPDRNYPNYDIIGVKKGADRINKGMIIPLNGYLIAMLHKIFLDGKSVDDQNCPQDFREYFYTIKEFVLSIFEKVDNKEYLFYIMSLTAKDFGEKFYQIISKNLKEDRKIRKKIKISNAGYALGDLTDSLEQNLFYELEITELKRKERIEILSKAVWRNKNFIFNIDRDKAILYFEEAIKLLKEKLPKEKYIMNRKIKGMLLANCLEYIYAVFRLRDLNDEKILKAISLNNSYLRDLYTIIEKCIEEGVTVKSKLKFKDINKKGNDNIPDLLYAILVCINGSDEEDIKISEISNDGDENE
ncbi:MAG: hypothetical protein HXM17_00765 [Fusobacterium periodonticum]|nr:hypothetical protein [Fusobacterium periodonticum]